MKNIIKIGLLTLAAGVFTSCDDVFEPVPENNLPLDYLEENSSYAENVLGGVYIYLPTGIPYNEPATDDAVSNDANNSWRQMASGRWTSSNNPMNRWESCRIAIQYCNIFLEQLDKVTWAADEKANQLFHDRFYAEAHALRGMLMFYLIQAHGGVDNAGNLLGIPIVEKAEDASSEFNVPRNTFAECLDAIKKDFEVALKYLPTEYGEEYFNEVAEKYPGISEGHMMRVFGAGFMGRVSGRIIKAYLSRATLCRKPCFQCLGNHMGGGCQCGCRGYQQKQSSYGA